MAPWDAGSQCVMTLSKHPVEATRPNLIFSSVGDHGNLPRWLRGRRNFDLWGTYYGETRGRFRDRADYYNQRRGANVQTLLFASRPWPKLLARYAAILVMDDDLLISGSALSSLFDIRDRYDLWALPAAL